MVHVDGYRALIPILDLITNHIERNSYGFARISKCWCWNIKSVHYSIWIDSGLVISELHSKYILRTHASVGGNYKSIKTMDVADFFSCKVLNLKKEKLDFPADYVYHIPIKATTTRNNCFSLNSGYHRW